MPQGNLVAASTSISNATDGQYDGNRQCFVMSDGQHVAIFGPDGSSAMKYATSADGITWSAPVAAYNVTGPSTGITGAVQQGDMILLCGNSSNGSGGYDVMFYPLTYSTASKTLTGPGYGSVAVELAQVEAAYDSANAVYHVAVAGNSLVQMGVWNAASPGSPFGVSTSTTVTSPVIYDIVCFTASGTTTILVLYGAQNGLFVLPMTYSGGTAGSYTLGAAETVSGSAVTGAACSLDSSNNLDIVYVASTKLYALRRTGTKVYSSIVNLAGSAGSGVISLATNGADLVVLYESITNQANGEIYYVWRVSGTWGNPTRFAGGDSGGYAVPKATPTVVSGVLGAIYQASGGVYALSTSASNAPNAPTVTAPSGTEASLTPTITLTHNNPNAPTDTQGALEVKVTVGATTMWDSGKVSQTSGSIGYGLNSNTSDPNYVAPAALAYGTTYTVTARTWDVVNNTASGWSTAVTFTPQQGGTATITQIVDNGSTLTATPATISGATITSTTVSWSQAASGTATQYQQRLYANDGVTLLASTAWTLFTTALASGSSAVLPSWTPAMNNSTTYQYAVALQDGTTGLQSESAHWTLNTAWTPPSPVTGLTVTPQPTTGNIVLTWTNPPAV